LLPASETYRIADQVAAAVQEAASLNRRDQEFTSLPFSTLQMYLQARSELHERRTGFRQRLAETSAELVRIAPEFAAGHAIRAVACIFGNESDSIADPPVDLRCARAAVNRALELDPELAEAHAAAGLLAQSEETFCRKGCAGGHWLAAAQRSLEHAVRLDPTLIEARIWLANIYEERGDLARAAEQRDAALALDPLSPIANHHVCNMMILRGESELVRTRLLRIARTPGMPYYIYEQLADIAVATQRFEEARTWARMMATDVGHRWPILSSAALLARTGERDAARAMYARAARNPEPFESVGLYYAVRVQQVLDGPVAVRGIVDGQLNRLQGLLTPVEVADRDLKRTIGWALALADQPGRARPWLEDIYGASGAPNLRFGDILTEADGLEALAWSYEVGSDTARSRLLARSALELLSTMAAGGFDQQATFALNRALAFKLAGERDSAIAELERAAALGWTEPVFFRQDPRWSDFNSDHAVRALLARIDERAAALRVAAR
jgi:tetratricopeptide (TPR) repeat protein